MAIKDSFTVRDLPVFERPRERLVNMGAEALSAQELIALIIGKGTAGESVMMTAQRLLSKFGSLEGVMDASLEDLQILKGLGLAKAAQIKACLEIGKRAGPKNRDNNALKKKEEQVTSAREVYDIVESRLRAYSKEHFFVLCFDVRNAFLGIDKVSVGTLTANLVHPRETFEPAFRRHANHIIVAHNHPSGDPEPSEDDIAITRRLKEAGDILGIALVDHVIAAKDKFLSFKDRNLI